MLCGLAAVVVATCGAPLLALRGGDRPDRPEDALLISRLKELKERLGALEQAQQSTPKEERGEDPTIPVLVDPAIGDRVRVRRDVRKPKYEWGGATPESVGRLVAFELPGDGVSRIGAIRHSCGRDH